MPALPSFLLRARSESGPLALGWTGATGEAHGLLADGHTEGEEGA